MLESALLTIVWHEETQKYWAHLALKTKDGESHTMERVAPDGLSPGYDNPWAELQSILVYCSSVV